MKSLKQYGFASLAAASLLFAACADHPKADTATVTTEQAPAATGGVQYKVDNNASFIRFTGYGVGKNHPGKFSITSGMVMVADNKITGGSFAINIKSMALEQKDDMIQNKLLPHLLSKDFFDADNNGTGKFEITKVEAYSPNSKDTSVVAGANYNLSGNLTLKGATKNVTFPANIAMNGDMLKATANFNIDRRDWNMTYGADKSLGDKFISETVNIQVDLQAKK